MRSLSRPGCCARGVQELRADADTSTGVRELDGVVQDVGQDLDKARGVDVERDRLLGKVQLPCVERRAMRLDRRADERVKRRQLALQPNVARVDARHVEQVVYQTHHV